MKTDELIAELRAQTEALVKRGGNVKADTAHLVEEASNAFYGAADGLSSLVKAVAEGAVAGAKDSVPEHAESVLRSVAEGVTDGLTKAAQAVQLTLQESNASGTRFAHEDLKKIAQDFKLVADMMVDILTTAAGQLSAHARNQAHSLGEHARQALHGVRSALDPAILAAQQDPVLLGRETMHAGASAARQAVGVLFSEMGKYLENTGKKLQY